MADSYPSAPTRPTPRPVPARAPAVLRPLECAMTPDPTGHPPADQLRAYGDGLLPPPKAAALEEHLAGCEACCRALEGAPTAALIERLRAHPEARDWLARPVERATET